MPRVLKLYKYKKNEDITISLVCLWIVPIHLLINGKLEQGRLLKKLSNRIWNWPTEKWTFTQLRPRIGGIYISSQENDETLMVLRLIYWRFTLSLCKWDIPHSCPDTPCHRKFNKLSQVCHIWLNSSSSKVVPWSQRLDT